jgi:dTMP kinase
MARRRGLYIVIEGQDATGKSTQVEMLAEYFRELGLEVVTIHEPDGDLASTHVLRDLIKSREYNLEPQSHVLLFTAARVELWRKLAQPVLDRGGIIIAARNWYSTLVYQGYGQGVDLDIIRRTTRNLLPARYVTPDFTVILTLDDAERDRRLHSRDDETLGRKSDKDTFESRPQSFQDTLSASYLKVAEELGIPTLDASPSPEDIQAQIRAVFDLS